MATEQLCVHGRPIACAECAVDSAAEIDRWMGSAAGYGSDAVEWKIRAEHAEKALTAQQEENARLRMALTPVLPYLRHDLMCAIPLYGNTSDQTEGCTCYLRQVRAALAP